MATKPISPVLGAPMDDAVYAAQAGILARLKDGRDKAQGELSEVEAQLHGMLVQRLDAGDEGAALALIAGADDGEAQIESLTAMADKLRRSLAAHRKAIVIQRARVAELRAEVSAEAAFASLPEHKLAVAGILSAVAALEHAVAVERKVRGDLTARDFEARLQDFSPPFGFSEYEFTHTAWRAKARKYVR